jgi:hypothetical protein
MNDIPARDGFLFTTEQFRKEMPLDVKRGEATSAALLDGTGMNLGLARSA